MLRGFAAIFTSQSGREGFIKALWAPEWKTFPSSPVCVSGEAGASHSTKEYLSFQLVRWIKWPSRRVGSGKEGEFKTEREVRGWRKLSRGNVLHKRSRERERMEKMLTVFHSEENKTIRNDLASHIYPLLRQKWFWLCLLSLVEGVRHAKTHTYKDTRTHSR